MRLENFFLRLEEESAQRALKEEERERLEAEAEGRITAQELADEALPTFSPSSPVKTNQELGYINAVIPREDSPSKAQHSMRWSCPTPSLYSLAGTDSASSSTLSAKNIPTMTTVCVLKRSFMNSVRRRLSRARNTLPLPLHILDGRDNFTVIVSIEESTTVQHVEEVSPSTQYTNTSVVYATVLRKKASAGWVSKAKNITYLFRQKTP
ncbi:hypothetical protein EIP86_006217 [Pleurotus ostreatoroseus]|nr:hypothetical protein EIP86_006217 [Pleurotus ostreatoroseus]